MFRTLSLALALLFALAATALAQQFPYEASNWYFGRRAGLRFTPGQALPEPLFNPNSLYSSTEGSASISDSAGNLLFYTGDAVGGGNYTKLYTANHEVMPGGTAIVGGASSTQATLLIKRPGNPRLYYCFSVAQLENYGTARSNGFCVTEIDLRDSVNPALPGLGRAVPGRINLLITDSTAEKLTATNHANGRWVWVLAHNGRDAFCRVLVTDSGLSRPRLQLPGFRTDSDPDDFESNEMRGSMKFSPDGRWLAMAMTNAWVLPTGESFHRTLLCRFDNATGLVSNPISITTPGTAIFGFYGVEFSPDSRKLYLGHRGLRQVMQFDLTVEDSIAVRASKVVIPTNNAEPGCLQLGPDGQLYISLVGNSRNLMVIRRPNAKAGLPGATGDTLLTNFFTLGTVADRGLNNLNTSLFKNLMPPTASKPSLPSQTLRITTYADRAEFTTPQGWPGGEAALYSLSGALVQKQTLAPGTARCHMQRGSLPPGTYLLRLGQQHTGKVSWQ